MVFFLGFHMQLKNARDDLLQGFYDHLHCTRGGMHDLHLGKSLAEEPSSFALVGPCCTLLLVFKLAKKQIEDLKADEVHFLTKVIVPEYLAKQSNHFLVEQKFRQLSGIQFPDVVLVQNFF